MNDIKEKETNEAEAVQENDVPHDKTVRLMSPTRMVVRRFFRSKLSIVGLIMVVGLFIFSFAGPLLYTEWGEIELDESGKTEYSVSETTYTVNGKEYTVRQTTEKSLKDNFLDAPSATHILGTDNEGYDIFVRLMYGGRISLTVSFIAVFLITILGVILGGIAGYFGGAIDNIIMRLCDILICLPGIPILLIISTILDASDIDAKYRIYLLMIYLTFISWPGTARLVRGQILSLREQDFMVATEATGLPIRRRIFRHLIPNVMPQLIVTATMGLGSVILTESTLSFLGLGVKHPMATWGTMINSVATSAQAMTEYTYIWIPVGCLICLTVVAFNFVGDGLRDAFDPKMKR